MSKTIEYFITRVHILTPKSCSYTKHSVDQTFNEQQILNIEIQPNLCYCEVSYFQVQNLLNFMILETNIAGAITFSWTYQS